MVEENKPTDDQKLTEQDQPIPIEKKCSRCGEIKLLSEFDIAHKSTCERNRREEDSEFCCDGEGHTNTCLINKTLVTIYYELDVFPTTVLTISCFLTFRIQNLIILYHLPLFFPRPWHYHLWFRDNIRTKSGINGSFVTANAIQNLVSYSRQPNQRFSTLPITKYLTKFF